MITITSTVVSSLLFVGVVDGLDEARCGMIFTMILAGIEQALIYAVMNACLCLNEEDSPPCDSRECVFQVR